jgi:hypothetical protein
MSFYVCDAHSGDVLSRAVEAEGEGFRRARRRTPRSLLLILALTTWLIVALFFVALCRGAASADGRSFASTESYPTAASRAPGGRGRAGRYVTGS